MFSAQSQRKFIESYADLFLLIGCIVVLSIVPLLRAESSFIIGREAYSIFRMAENPATWDSLSYGGRFAAYTWGTALLVSIKPRLLSQLLPPLFGFLAFLCLWGIFKSFGLEANTRRIALAITVASPPFIFLFSTLNSTFVAITLSLFGLYCLARDHKIISAIAFIIMPIFNLPVSLISLMLLFIITFFAKKREFYWLIFICTAIVATAYYLTLAKYAGNPEKLAFSLMELGMQSKLQTYFSDLGGKFGLSVFGVILAMLGIVHGWKKKYENLAVFFCLFILVILMFLTNYAIFFINFFVAILAAYALMSVASKGWESSTLKNFTILVMVCGLIFSSVSFMDRHIAADPTPEVMQALEIFKDNDQGVTFSHYTRGYWLEYAGKKTVMDENFAFAPDVNERWRDSQTLFNTRQYEEAMGVIDKYNIRYIWLDSDLRSHLWSQKEEGLQFLLEYSKNFKKVYSTNQVEIWEVL